MTGCTSGLSAVQPKAQYSQKGATVSTPDQSGWLLLEHTQESIALARAFPNKESAVLNTYYFWIGETDSDETFFKKIVEGRTQVGNEKRFRQLDVNYQPVTLKGQACLQYEGTAEYQQSADALPDGTAYFTNHGYICRSRIDKASAILMEISYRSALPAMPDAINTMGETFFSNIRLTEK